jgi:hypothetical protein
MQNFIIYFLNLNLHRDIIMLNLNKEGRPFAKIIGGKYNNQVISVSEKSDEGFKIFRYSKRCKISINSKS